MFKNFLGSSPKWYKTTMLGFLIVNTLLYFLLPTFLDHHTAHSVLSWLFIGEFIFTLAMALKCYPLLPGGLLAIQAVVIGMTSSETVFYEIGENIKVILLLVFMVAGIHFMGELIKVIFT